MTCRHTPSPNTTSPPPFLPPPPPHPPHPQPPFIHPTPLTPYPQVDPSVLAWFDSDGEEKLIHFRFLPAERRAAAAQYIMQQNLDAPVSRSRGWWDASTDCVCVCGGGGWSGN
jgi:hypothetical protein